MFKLDPDPTFWADVEIPAPGGVRKFKLEFAHMNRGDYAEWAERGAAKKSSVKATIQHEADLFMEVCRSWDIDGLEFNRDNLVTLLNNYVKAGGAIMTAYIKGLSGESVKN